MPTKRVADKKTTAPKRVRSSKSDGLSTVVHTDAVDREAIAQRAYERFIARGYRHGHDVEDWLAAERELTHSS
jgi:hypothetical protein